MESPELYKKLDQDFIGPELSDEWAEHMGEVEEFISDNFKKRSMGLVCDFAKEIDQVYTAVFPTNEVMQKILKKDTENAMLFVHHPSIWDITKAPEVFQQMDKKLLMQFKKRNISIYNLHVPLDNYGEYSTSKTLAEALDIKSKKSFAPYFGALCGVIGNTEYNTLDKLMKKFEEVVGHKVKLYNYGDKKINDNEIAVVAGGGNDRGILSDVAKAGINTFVTGITALNDHSKQAHDYAKNNGINILGGTHYSTEKFACQKMCEYFEKLGLPCEFIEGKPGMKDI